MYKRVLVHISMVYIWNTRVSRAIHTRCTCLICTRWWWRK